MLLQNRDIHLRSKNDERCCSRGRALLKTFPDSRLNNNRSPDRPVKLGKSVPDGVAWTIMNTRNAICGPMLANAFFKGFTDNFCIDGANGFRRVPAFAWESCNPCPFGKVVVTGVLGSVLIKDAT